MNLVSASQVFQTTFIIDSNTIAAATAIIALVEHSTDPNSLTCTCNRMKVRTPDKRCSILIVLRSQIMSQVSSIHVGF